MNREMVVKRVSLLKALGFISHINKTRRDVYITFTLYLISFFCRT